MTDGYSEEWREREPSTAPSSINVHFLLYSQTMQLTFHVVATSLLIMASTIDAFQSPQWIGHRRPSGVSMRIPPQNDMSIVLRDSRWKRGCSWISLSADDDMDIAPDVTTGEEANDASNDTSAVISTFKSNLNPRRSFTPTTRIGSTSPKSIDVTMKFGGSSLANSERIDYVTKLIRDRIHPTDENDTPVRPRAGKFQGALS